MKSEDNNSKYPRTICTCRQHNYLEVRYPAFAFETLHYPWTPSCFYDSFLSMFIFFLFSSFSFSFWVSLLTLLFRFFYCFTVFFFFAFCSLLSCSGCCPLLSIPLPGPFVAPPFLAFSSHVLSFMSSC